MKQKPFTAAQLAKLRKQGEAAARTGDGTNHVPVVKLFCPWGAATWLISEIDEDGDTLFGLCDLGHGCPELGRVSLAELRAVRGPAGLTIERDIYWSPEKGKTLVNYAEEAWEAGRIVA